MVFFRQKIQSTRDHVATHTIHARAHAYSPQRGHNIANIASLELAMQVVFDHAKSQLPEAIAKRVLERCFLTGAPTFKDHPVLPQRALSVLPSIRLWGGFD